MLQQWVVCVGTPVVTYGGGCLHQQPVEASCLPAPRTPLSPENRHKQPSAQCCSQTPHCSARNAFLTRHYSSGEEGKRMYAGSRVICLNVMSLSGIHRNVGLCLNGLFGIKRAKQIKEWASPQAAALTGQRNWACRAQNGTVPRATLLVVGLSGLMLMDINVSSLDGSEWHLWASHWVVFGLHKQSGIVSVCFLCKGSIVWTVVNVVC